LTVDLAAGNNEEILTGGGSQSPYVDQCAQWQAPA
jgi:hypothetical protein